MGAPGWDVGSRALGAVLRRLGSDIAVLSELGRGAHTAVYRIRRGESDYALKVLHTPPPGGTRAATVLCREAALLARVDNPGVPDVFDVGVVDGHPYLVLEFIDGQALSELLEHGPVPEPRLLRMATEVTMALAAAHRAGVIHRDIKPANIVITRQSDARLIDFDLATANRSAPIADSVVGTFHYSPPEQSGMLHRPVDHRADLYALGVVLYQCATGQLPFTADDVGVLIAMHANLPAPDPRTLRPELSAGLAAVIGRLLAKDPDDRPQNAGELLAALGSLRGVPSNAGTDWAGRYADLPLVGRDEEQTLLADRWKQARSGHGGMVVISGAPGSGKTSLAQSLVAAAHLDGALVLSGKCDVDSSVPLAALRSAVEDWLRCVARLPAGAKATAMAGLRAAAGAGAGLLRSLSPLLAVALDAPVLDADDRHEQFAGAVASLLATLPGEAGGLLVLDDAQWLDAASLAVVRRLAEDIAEVPLLVVATVRDDDTSRDGLAALRAAAGPAIDLQIPVGPLGTGATEHLVSSYLAGSTVGPEVLGQLAAAGGGNPFTILEYLRALIDAGALRPCWGTWRLDTDVLQRISLPSGVLDLVLARIDGVGGHTREMLTVAAAIGNVVPTGLLAAVTGVDPAGALVEAAARGLVRTRVDVFTFVHDRIREALLSAVGPADRMALHHRIATALDAQRRTDPAEVYATARHYASGRIGQAPDRVFLTCWEAGQLALDENAPHTALSFFEAARAAARCCGRPLDSRFREALAVAYWSTGQVAAARGELEVGLAAETDPVRRAALLLQLAQVLRTDWELSRSVACARAGLAELGARVPDNPVLLGMATARIMLSWLVIGSRAPAARPVEGRDGERLLLKVLLCRAAVAAAAIDLRHGLVVAYTLQAYPRAHLLGATGGYVTHLAGIGSIAGSLGLRKRRDRIYRQAKQLATNLGDPKAYANAAWHEAFSKILGKEILVDDWAEVSESQRRWLELDYYTNILLMRCRDLVQRGYAVEALAWCERARTRIAAAGPDAFPGFAVLTSMAHALLGHAGDAAAALAARAAEPLDPGHRIQFILGAIHTALEQDELDDPCERAVEAFDRLGLPLSAIFTEYRMIYTYVAFIRLTQLQRADAATRARRLTAARAAVRALRRAAIKSGPAAGPLARTLLYGYFAVARASLAQLSGRHEESLTLLARDEAQLVRLDAPLVGYEAARVRARALAGLGEQQLATQQARAAHAMAVDHGWTRRAHWIRIEFGATATASRSVDRLPSEPQQRATADPYRRRLAALQQVSTAAAKILDPAALARVALDETLRILGAERAILFLVDGTDGSLVPAFGRGANRGDLATLHAYSSSLVARVAADRQPLVVAGSEEGAALGSQSAVVHGLRSIMIAPLELDQRLIGIVYLDSRVASGVFAEADIGLLTAVTSHIAVSFETARAAQLDVAVRVARQQRDIAELLRRAMHQLTSVTDPDQVLRHLLTITVNTLSAQRGCLLHRDGTALTSLGNGTVRLDAADLVALTACAGPAYGGGGQAPDAVAAVLGDVSSWLIVPLTTHGHGRGVLIAGSSAHDAFNQAHVDLIAALASQGAAAYDSARLFARVHELATTDALTGVPNRRHFTELAIGHLAAARRDRRPLLAMMIDIDHFKQVNDTYGHAAGDDVIRAVAQTLRRAGPPAAVVGRYGGEEFVVLQTWTGDDPAMPGERLRAATAAQAVPTTAGTIQVTVSIGTAVLTPGDDLETLLRRADDALYTAKQAGRNQVATTRYGPDRRRSGRDSAVRPAP